MKLPTQNLNELPEHCNNIMHGKGSLPSKIFTKQFLTQKFLDLQ